jgi:hypothetical protein
MASSPEAVDRLHGAFRDRDIVGIGQCFDEGALSTQWGTSAVVAGRADIELMYDVLMRTHPNLSVRIDERMTVGDVVVDHEAISGYSHMPEDAVVHKVYVYTVREGLIRSMMGFNSEA